MRILVNRGGQQLGPFSLEELRAAIRAGQISQQDLAWWEGSPSWVSVAQVPGLNMESPNPAHIPPGAVIATENPAGGLAITSLVLGISSLLGLSCISGIPAVICGHMAMARQKKAGYSSTGVALAGLITGYLGTVMITLIALLAAIAVPNFIRAKQRAQLTKSMTNARQIVMSCQIYQADHNGEFPASLDDLGEYKPAPNILTDPLSPLQGPDGYWYIKPSRTAPAQTVVVASRGQTADGKHALAHKDGSADSGPFRPPLEH